MGHVEFGVASQGMLIIWCRLEVCLNLIKSLIVNNMIGSTPIEVEVIELCMFGNLKGTIY